MGKWNCKKLNRFTIAREKKSKANPKPEKKKGEWISVEPKSTMTPKGAAAWRLCSASGDIAIAHIEEIVVYSSASRDYVPAAVLSGAARRHATQRAWARSDSEKFKLSLSPLRPGRNGWRAWLEPKRARALAATVIRDSEWPLTVATFNILRLRAMTRI